MDDDMLLEALNGLSAGDLQNAIQAACELPGPLAERLAKGYQEVTNTEGGPDDIIGLR